MLVVNLVLQVFYDATLYVSKRGSPNLPMVIPTIDLIDKVLTDHSLKSEYRPSIHATCALGKVTLNWYYNKTDESEMFQIAIGKFCCNLFL